MANGTTDGNQTPSKARTSNEQADNAKVIRNQARKSVGRHPAPYQDDFISALPSETHET